MFNFRKNNIDISKLSQQEIQDLAVLLLKKIPTPTKGLGKDLFDVFTRLTISVAVEAVCLRTNPETKNIEVYLTQRSLDNTAYPNQWHCPGSIMRRAEEIEDIFVRLEKIEFGIKILSKKFVANFNNPKEARGHFFTLLYLCTLENAVGLGNWFPVAQLPENIIKHHKNIVIPAVVKEFESNLKP